MDSLFNPVRVLIGEKSVSKLPSLIKNRKYVVVSSPGFESRNWNNYFLNSEYIIDTIGPNPTIGELVVHIELLGKIKFDTLVAIGGGSVIDTAKALSVFSDSSEESITECLEGNRECPSKNYDVVAIPTTAGTGAEVTSFATIWDDKNNRKLSLYTPLIYPRNAIIDPILALTLDSKMTAISGLDALSHCFESLWNKNANPLSKSMAFLAIDLILETLDPLLDNLNDLEMRSKMAWASLLGGFCINQTKTALAHSMSYPLTSHLEIPHGLASGAFLPEILKFNRKHDITDTVEEIYKKLSNYIPLDERLGQLYQKLNQCNLFQRIQTNQSTINSLVPQMIDPERSVNNIADASYKDILSILDLYFHKN